MEKLEELLGDSGLDEVTIEQIDIEIRTNEIPPGFLGKFKSTVDALIKEHYGHLKAEVFETYEIFEIINEKVKSKTLFNQEEKSKIRSQMTDIVKLFPAGMFAALNALLPIPGTSLLTPLVLAKLGLLPSRWRDAHILNKLKINSNKFCQQNLNMEAEALKNLSHYIDNENLKKDKVNLNANLLSYWDINKNHKWDSNEKIAYLRELEKVSEILLKKGFDRRWYISLGEEIWGPLSINKIIPKAPQLDENMMVCWDGKSGWVDIQDLHENKSQV